jgi:hypothetical protein
MFSSCVVLSRLVLCCLVLSCFVLSCVRVVLCCLVQSHLVFSGLVLPDLVCLVLSSTLLLMSLITYLVVSGEFSFVLQVVLYRDFSLCN